MNYIDMDMSPDFIVLGIIWKAQQKDKPIHFTGIVEELNGAITRSRISSAHDRLCGLGIITTKWVIRDKRGLNVLLIESECQKLARDILTYMESPKKED